MRKKTPAATRTEAKKLLEKVRARMLPCELGLFDPGLKCPELVTRYLDAVKGTEDIRHSRAASFRRPGMAATLRLQCCGPLRRARNRRRLAIDGNPPASREARAGSRAGDGIRHGCRAAGRRPSAERPTDPLR